jgi:hypothetical protein
MATTVFHPVANTVEVVTFAARRGNQRRNVIHYQYSGPRPSTTELTNLGNDVIADILPTQGQLTCSGTDWYQVTLRDIHDVAGEAAALPVGGVGGAGGTNPLPGASSVCMTKRTGRPGPSFRGRFFLFDLDETQCDSDDLNPFINIFMTALAGKILTVRQGGRFTPCVASKHLRISTKMTAMTWDQIMDTQVRRGRGRGV